MKVKRQGGCHCGKVRIEINAEASPEILECNCSICTKTGYLHLIVDAADFTILSGKENITTYHFGTGVAQHYFCKTCGIKPFYVPRSHPNGFSVNLRCLDNFYNINYSTKKFDGQNWEKHYAANYSNDHVK